MVDAIEQMLPLDDGNAPHNKHPDAAARRISKKAAQ